MATLRRRLLFQLVTNQRLEQQVRRSPTLERRAYAMARRYVAGETIQDMLGVIAGLRDQGIAASVDFFGELRADPAAAERATADYIQLAKTLAQVEDTWLAIDLSHIGLDVSVDACRRHLATIVEALPAGRCIQGRRRGHQPHRPDPAGRDRPGGQGRAADGDRAGQPAPQPSRRRPARRGRRAGPAGQGSLPGACGTRLSVGRGDRRRLPAPGPSAPGGGAAFSLATHDPMLREALLLALGPSPVEMLLGVRPQDARDLVHRGVKVRCYVPYGPDWFRCWMRRLAESQGTR